MQPNRHIASRPTISRDHPAYVTHNQTRQIQRSTKLCSLGKKLYKKISFASREIAYSSKSNLTNPNTYLSLKQELQLAEDRFYEHAITCEQCTDELLAKLYLRHV